MRTLSLSSFVLCSIVIGCGVIGCGGSARTADDAGTGGGNDAFTPGVDAFTPGVDAATPGDDAFVAPGDDAATGSGACTNTSDEAVTGGASFQSDLGNCAMMHFTEPGLMTCIQGLGLSSACAMCFDTEVHCTIMHCVAQCAGGDSPACTTCRATNCDPAFNTCAGF
jgi:hypothetical protein